MSENIYDKWGVPTVINCVGYSTRVGGSSPADDVVEAMRQAQRHFIEIDDLQAAASACIARHTGAQAGIVTCGAGAALTLAAAACLTGNDPDLMEALPDTSGIAQNRIIYPKPHSFDYDHAVRLSGAHVDFIDYDQQEALQKIEAAITPATAAIGYVWKRTGQSPSVQEVADLAHRYNLPLIVDAALSLPPTEHLRAFIEQGADLVALSGGKHLGGPQASGLLFGKKELIQSAWVQMVDMDVRPATWSLHHWVESGWINWPPRHGIGRSMKVSKEAIIGVLTALENYPLRDHEAELAVWQNRIEKLAALLGTLPSLQVEPLFPASNGQPYPVLKLRRGAGMSPLLNKLKQQNPKIILAEDEDDTTLAWLFPMQLRDNEIVIIADRFRGALEELS